MGGLYYVNEFYYYFFKDSKGFLDSSMSEIFKL